MVKTRKGNGGTSKEFQIFQFIGTSANVQQAVAIGGNSTSAHIAWGIGFMFAVFLAASVSGKEHTISFDLEHPLTSLAPLSKRTDELIDTISLFLLTYGIPPSLPWSTMRNRLLLSCDPLHHGNYLCLSPLINTLIVASRNVPFLRLYSLENKRGGHVW